MALKPLLSFSTGELDPSLHDFVTLEKFNKGLATARNVLISKTGSIKSRFSRAHFVKCKDDGVKVKLFCPPNSSVLTEWGPFYVRAYNFSGSVLYTATHSYTAADLEIIQFVADATYLYAFVKGKTPIKLAYRNNSPALASLTSTMFSVFEANSLSVTPAGTPSGYRVDYLVTPVLNGEEGIGFENSGLTNYLPIAAGQSNTIALNGTITYPIWDEIRVYRRPTGGGAYGFIGSSRKTISSSARFFDYGGEADYTRQPPEIITYLGDSGITIENLKPASGLIYQQRLLLANTVNDLEAIITSRPGYKNNFYRDIPYDADSALKFKAGTTGTAEVLRMIDAEGLIVFTTAGIYTNTGILTINNVALQKRGNWVIDPKIAPLIVPGGIFFVDISTNSIRQFVYSNDIQNYETLDKSIFSNHIFKNRTIVSWAFHNGSAPLIIVNFSDGTFATFTYDYEHQMNAWTRHDSVYPIEQVEGTSTADATFFVTNRNGNRYIEVTLPREIPSDTYITNPEADKLSLNFLMDALKTKSNLINNSLVGTDIIFLVIGGSGSWEGALSLLCGTSSHLFPLAGLGAPGTVLRYFDTVDKSIIDLTVLHFVNDNQLVVQPSCLFPSDQATNIRLYETFTQVTGLNSHLEGESVCVVADGGLVASPNNDQENFPTLTVSGGIITLPNNLRGAIIIVGRPVTADIKTLNISTVEQAPTVIESLTVNKLFIRMQNARGLFISNKFPEEKSGTKDGKSVLNMESLDENDIPDGYDLIANRYLPFTNKRIEKTLPGTWNSQGQICLRQVDPLHFEILSVIADVEIHRR